MYQLPTAPNRVPLKRCAFMAFVTVSVYPLQDMLFFFLISAYASPWVCELKLMHGVCCSVKCMGKYRKTTVSLVNVFGEFALHSLWVHIWAVECLLYSSEAGVTDGVFPYQK